MMNKKWKILIGDLVLARLRKGDAMDGKTVSCKHDLCNCAIMDEAADRIKEPESKLAEYKMVASAIDGQWAAGLDEIEELKARLKKATRLMELSVELATWNTTLLEDVIDFITEQKEQSND